MSEMETNSLKNVSSVLYDKEVKVFKLWLEFISATNWQFKNWMY